MRSGEIVRLKSFYSARTKLFFLKLLSVKIIYQRKSTRTRQSKCIKNNILRFFLRQYHEHRLSKIRCYVLNILSLPASNFLHSCKHQNLPKQRHLFRDHIQNYQLLQNVSFKYVNVCKYFFHLFCDILNL